MNGFIQRTLAKALLALALALLCAHTAAAQTDRSFAARGRDFFARLTGPDNSNTPKPPPELLGPPRTANANNNAPAPPQGDRKQDEPATALPRTLVPPPDAVRYDLPGLTGIMLGANPRLAQAAAAIQSAAGRAVQAGLYPNPVFSLTVDELGDRTGRAGIVTAQLSQEILTAGKLDLGRAAADREIDQNTVALLSARYNRLGAVRQAYYEVLAIRRRVEVLGRLLESAEETVEVGQKLLRAKEAGRLDVTPLELERERVRLELETARSEIPAAFRRLAAAVGVTDLPQRPLAGELGQSLPEYDLHGAREFVSRQHPDIVAAHKGVLRAQALLARAEAEAVPNVTVLGGYVRQDQNDSNDVVLGVSVPIPCRNRNEGNIAAARGGVAEAIAAVGRAENDVIERFATAYGTYASAKRRAELYRSSILPRARENYEGTLRLYRTGAVETFNYLRVLEAQRAYFQAGVDHARALGEAWRAAADLSGLLLEEHWPEQPHPAVVPPPNQTPW